MFSKDLDSSVSQFFDCSATVWARNTNAMEITQLSFEKSSKDQKYCSLRGRGGVGRTSKDINLKSMKTDCFHKTLQSVQAAGFAQNTVSLRGTSLC